MPILLLANYAQTILQASRNFRIWNLIRVTDSFLFLVAVSLIFAFDIADITNVTVAFVACKCIILAFSGRYLRFFDRFTSLDRLACRDMFVYMGKCLPTGWMGQANTQLDQMLLSIFFRPELLGLYRVAVSAANFMRFVPIGFQRTVLSQTAAIENEGSQMQHIFRTAKQGGLLTLIALIPFFERLVSLSILHTEMFLLRQCRLLVFLCWLPHSWTKRYLGQWNKGYRKTSGFNVCSNWWFDCNSCRIAFTPS